MDLAIEKGELIVLLGPSGCGKTTTLRMIAGLELPTGGPFGLDGQRRHATRAPRGATSAWCFSSMRSIPTSRCARTSPSRCGRRHLAEPRCESRVDDVAERMGLGALLPRHPRQLSGGDQQKVSLARAIVRRPAVYLMDEPLGTLDADQRLAMREVIRAEQLASKVTTTSTSRTTRRRR